MKWNATGLLYPSQLCFLLCWGKTVLLSCSKLKKKKEKEKDKDGDDEDEKMEREREKKKEKEDEKKSRGCGRGRRRRKRRRRRKPQDTHIGGSCTGHLKTLLSFSFSIDLVKPFKYLKYKSGK